MMNKIKKAVWVKPGDDVVDARIKGAVAGLAIVGAVRIVADYSVGIYKIVNSKK